MSKCLRCERDLKDPQAMYGWRCAQILGIKSSNVLVRNDSFTQQQKRYNFERELEEAQIYERLREKYPGISASILDNFSKKVYAEFNNIAMPFLEQNGYSYYRDKDTGKTLKADLSTLEGMGFLPDGRIIIGDSNPDTEYFYSLMILKEQYHAIQRNVKINMNRKKEHLNDIYNQAYDIIRNKYPELSEQNVHERTMNNWLNIPSDYYTIHDVTDRLNNFMKSYELSVNWQIVQDIPILKIKDFFFEVMTYGPLDLKTNPDWQNSLFIYNREIVDRDALANIAYGYLGTFLGISESMLYKGADIEQIFESFFKNTKDDPRDKPRIKQGIDMFNSKQRKGETIDMFANFTDELKFKMLHQVINFLSYDPILNLKTGIEQLSKIVKHYIGK